jgi:hypothetical protein
MYSKLIVTKHKVELKTGYSLHELLQDLNNVPPSAIVEEIKIIEGSLNIVFTVEQEVKDAGNKSTVPIQG